MNNQMNNQINQANQINHSTNQNVNQTGGNQKTFIVIIVRIIFELVIGTSSTYLFRVTNPDKCWSKL